MMEAYLSIDLDYWVNHWNSSSCAYIFRKMNEWNIKFEFVKSHEQMLNDVNESRARVLYHIDYHSDITGFRTKKDADSHLKLTPKDGDWINYIKWRDHGVFYWFYPDVECYKSRYSINKGGTPGKGACWSDGFTNPFHHKKHTGWASLKRRQGFSQIKWHNVIKASVACSPDYIHYDAPGIKGVVDLFKLREYYL